MRGLVLCAKSHVLLVKSCSVMGDAVPALGPPWVKSCICYVSLVSWSDHSSLYNRTEIVTAAWQGRDSYRHEMTLAELTGTNFVMLMMKNFAMLRCKVVTAVNIQYTLFSVFSHYIYIYIFFLSLTVKQCFKTKMSMFWDILCTEQLIKNNIHSKGTGGRDFQKLPKEKAGLNIRCSPN